MCNKCVGTYALPLGLKRHRCYAATESRRPRQKTIWDLLMGNVPRNSRWRPVMRRMRTSSTNMRCGQCPKDLATYHWGKKHVEIPHRYECGDLFIHSEIGLREVRMSIDRVEEPKPEFQSTHGQASGSRKRNTSRMNSEIWAS